MKILCLSSVSYGGAGLYAISVEKILNEMGHQTFALYKDNSRQMEFSVYKKSLIEKLRTRFYKLIHSQLQFENKFHFYNKFEFLETASASKILNRCPFKPDAIVLFWVSEFINADTLSSLRLKTGAPIYWLMLDNAPITGGCHYPWQCKGFENKCFPCPAILSPKNSKIASSNLEHKHLRLPDGISLVCYSNNDFNRAVSSKVFRNRRIFKYLAFVDDSVYYPAKDKVFSKISWGINPELTVLTLGASNLNDERKGFTHLLNALNTIQNKNIAILVIGNCDHSLFENNAIITGNVNEADLIRAYQASDVYLSASLEDSGPIMINQALMCGVPVISYDTGVANNLVVSYKTGFSVKNYNPNGIIKGINWFLQLSPAQKHAISSNCREMALGLYGKEATKRNFKELFAN